MNKHSQGFPIQIVMMTILGLVLLSTGFYLSASIFDSGEEFSADMTNQLRTNMDSRYCEGSTKSLCAPTVVLRGEDSDVISVDAVNLESISQEYTLEVTNHSESEGTPLLNSECGTLAYDVYSQSVQIESSTTAQIPIAISKRNVNSVPCSFSTTMRLIDGSGSEVPDSRTALLIRVE